MKPGFLLLIDEAGDEGIDRVRPDDNDGGSEYFVLAGVLIRYERRSAIGSIVGNVKQLVGLEPHEELHLRDLSLQQQALALAEIGKSRLGLIAVVSNKRNMRGYRNLRVEARNLEYKGGRLQPQRHNWFYNHLFRYLLETASAECARWTKAAYGDVRKIEIIFSHRRNFRYSQTSSYLFKLMTEQHGRHWYNNKHQVNWTVVDPRKIHSARAKSEPGLQLADCVASGIFRAIDDNWFGGAAPELVEALEPRFLRLPNESSSLGYGFKLLPDRFSVPLTSMQIRSLRAIGWQG